MSCGARNGYNDVCGETYTCPTCMMGDEVDSLRARIAELERALKSVAAYVKDGECYCLNGEENLGRNPSLRRSRRGTPRQSQ